MTLSRRDLLTRAGAGVGLVATGNLGSLLTAARASALPASLGPLVDDPNGLLDLPEGFTYSIVSQAGDPLPNGGWVPDDFDGAAAFRAPRGGVRLVRNSELGRVTDSTYPALASPAFTYDPGAGGGTSTVTLDRHAAKVDEYVSLAGTWNNCAGGSTPWGSWLTCEETEQLANPASGITKDHGFVFEVDAGNPGNNATPTPLTALGRFSHEAVVVDPATGQLYLTEDASSPNGLVYRFTPNDTTRAYGALRNGGVLEAMRCTKRGTHVPDLSVFSTPGERLQIEWVPVPDPLAASLSIRTQFQNTEVTRSRKIEGAWWGHHRAYIVCSFARVSDGSLMEHDGQVWSYKPDTQILRLEVRFAFNPDPASDLPDGPDNIMVSPYGGLLLAEDGEGVQHLYAVSESGTSAPFARNARDDSEFAGACFSPDAATLFASIQSPGITFAITGPFATLA